MREEIDPYEKLQFFIEADMRGEVETEALCNTAENVDITLGVFYEYLRRKIEILKG